MTSDPHLQRAPARGRYSRVESAIQRFGAQRARLLRAVALGVVQNKRTVGEVVRLAGVGRSTFYECFDDFEHAASALQSQRVLRLRRALEAAAPTLSAVCRAWLEDACAEPVSTLAVLGGATAHGRSDELLAALVARGFAPPFGGAALLRQSAVAACANVAAQHIARIALEASQRGQVAATQRPPGGAITVSVAAAELERTIRGILG